MAPAGRFTDPFLADLRPPEANAATAIRTPPRTIVTTHAAPALAWATLASIGRGRVDHVVTQRGGDFIRCPSCLPQVFGQRMTIQVRANGGAVWPEGLVQLPKRTSQSSRCPTLRWRWRFRGALPARHLRCAEAAAGTPPVALGVGTHLPSRRPMP